MAQGERSDGAGRSAPHHYAMETVMAGAAADADQIQYEKEKKKKKKRKALVETEECLVPRRFAPRKRGEKRRHTIYNHKENKITKTNNNYLTISLKIYYD